jgi:hypothetical protein
VFGTRYTDLCYGYNAFWAKHLPKIDLVDCDGFEIETVMNVRAAKAGLSIQEIPSWEHNRLYGASNLKVFRDGVRIARFIIWERLSGSRSRGANARLGTSEAAPAADPAPAPAGPSFPPATVQLETTRD